MKVQILDRLAALERERGISILFACESGSRAWGFPSTDSDWDVRFVYLQPIGEYSSLFEPASDTIETPLVDGFDVGGWELRKALRLFRGGNAPLFEWLGSPIVSRPWPPSRPACASLSPRPIRPRKPGNLPKKICHPRPPSTPLPPSSCTASDRSPDHATERNR